MANSFLFSGLRTLHTNQARWNPCIPLSFILLRTLAETIGGGAYSVAQFSSGLTPNPRANSFISRTYEKIGEGGAPGSFAFCLD